MNHESEAALVGNEILRRVRALLVANQAGNDELQMAQIICNEKRNDPEYAEEIAAYTLVADQVTDGLFSATLQSWNETKQ